MNILLLDDDPLITKGLGKVLKREGYTVFTADRPSEAVCIAREELIDLLVCDGRMPESDGIEALGSLRRLQGGMRCILITGYAGEDAPIRAIKTGVDDYLVKPFNSEIFLKSVRNSLALRRLEKSAFLEASALKRKYLQLIATLVNLFLSRDNHFRDHVRKVASLSTDLGAELGLNEQQLDKLELSALLHDVGLATVDRDLLLKADPLTEAEKILLTQHPQTAARKLLSGISDLSEVIHVVEHLRENYDGSGHPKGLRGESIPLESRILRVAEAFDSLTSVRPQRRALSTDEAVRHLEDESGSTFDPQVVAICAALARENRQLSDPSELFSRSNHRSDSRSRAESLVTLAGLFRESGQADEAAQAFSYAEELMKRDKSGDLEAMLQLGKAETALKAGSRSQAARWAAAAKQVIESQPVKTARSVLDLCRVYMSLERLDLAKEVLTWFPESDPLDEEKERLSLRLCFVSGEGEAFASRFTGWWQEGLAIVGLSPADAREATGILLAAFRMEAFRETAKTGLSKLVGRYPHLRTLVQTRLPSGTDFAFLPTEEQGPQQPSGQTSGSVLEIHLLGTLEVRFGHNTVSPKGWTTRKARELFSLLAYHGRPLAAGRLEEQLWPHGGDKVRTNLHTTVSRVRRALRQAAGQEHSILQSEGDFYFLDSEVPTWCDVKEFESLAQRITQSSPEEPLSLSREKAAQKCLTLYRGDFLEGIWEDWTLQVRTNLRETWFAVASRLGHHYLGQEDYRSAEACFRDMLGKDFCREEAHSGLIRSALAQERRDQAVKLYHAYARKLESEMNLKPSAELHKLYLEVIDQQ